MIISQISVDKVEKFLIVRKEKLVSIKRYCNISIIDVELYTIVQKLSISLGKFVRVYMEMFFL